ncbi:MAG: insulinase family protein [Deltaproteobacteria bacterium]|nr:insulinase family protein [Deltaproteobacteria bacterium]
MRRKTIVIILTFLFLVPTLCWAGEILRCRLENGMRVILQESHAAPVTAFQVWVEVGSADENPGQTGISHLIEHMIFKGTNKRRVGEIAGAIERYGGHINAYTSYDYTVYHVVIASRYQEKGLEVLADAIQYPSFDPQELASEKEVVIEEIKMGQDDPGHMLHKALFRNSFRRHPYGRPIIGYAEKVKGFSRDEVFNYYKKWYAPENMIFVGVGDFSTQKLLSRLKTLFTSPSGLLPPRQRPSNPPQEAFRPFIMQGDFRERYFALGFHIPSVRDEDMFALDLLAAILGQGESSRLQRELRIKRGVVSSIYAYAFTPKDPGLFVIKGALRPGGVKEGIKGIIGEISRIKEEGIGEEELRKVKVMVEADFTYDQETVQGEARKLGYFEMVMGDATKEGEYLHGIFQVRGEEIKKVAVRYLRPENLTLCLLLPEGQGEIVNPRTLEELVKGLEVTAAPQEMAGEMNRTMLENGITLLFHEDHSLPVVGICGVFMGGVRFEKEQEAGLTHFVSKMLTRGTESYNAIQLAQEVDSIGATLRTFSGRNSFGVQAKGLSKDFSHLLRLVASVITEPSFPPKEVEKVRGEILAALGKERDRMVPWTMRLLRETLYERHPYRLNALGEEGTIERIGRRDLVRYYKRYVIPPNLVLAIAGDAKWKEVLKSVKGAFQGLRRANFSPPLIPQELKKRVIKKNEVEREKRQVHLALGFLGTNLKDQDRFPLEVLEAALGGQGGRFFTQLRDKEGLAYVVAFFVRSDLDPGYLGLYLATSPQKAEQALRGVKRILQEVRQRGISSEELVRAKNYLIGNYEIGLQGPLALASTMAFDERYGLGGDFYHRYPGEIERVTQEDVMRVARKYITMDSYALVIAGPSSP